MTIRVPLELIRYYIDYFISEYVDDNGEPPVDLADLDDYLPNLKAHLARNHELVFFISGLYAAVSEDSNFQKYYGYNFPLENKEIKNIMSLLLISLRTEGLDLSEKVVVSTESLDNFRILVGLTYRVLNGDTLNSIANKEKIGIEVIKQSNPFWYEKKGLDGSLEEGEVVRLKVPRIQT